MKQKAVCSRREFCGGMGKALTALFAAHALGLRKASAVPLEESIVLDLKDSANAALTQIGGAMYVPHPLDANPLIVIRISATEAVAFSSSCPHRQCQVDLPVDGVLACPCHASTFDTRGNVTGEPAQENLESFAATLLGDTITVGNPSTLLERSEVAASKNPFRVTQHPGHVMIIGNGALSGWSAKIFNANGQAVASLPYTRRTRLSWNCSGVPSGNYFISITTAGGKFLRKVTILK